MENLSKKQRFLMGAALIGGVNVLLRSVAVSFNAYVSSKVGAEGMGLLTLVMSVFGMSVTLATSGISLASMRLVAEKLAPLAENGAAPSEYRKCVRSVILKCCIYSLLFGVSTGIAVNLLAGFIGERLLGDVRTIASIKIFAYSLPAISLSSALSGYFTGVRKVHKNAVASIIEQGVKIILTSTALSLTVLSVTDKIEYSCIAVVGGGAVAEGFSLSVNFIMYLFDSRRPAGICCKSSKIKSQSTKFGEVCSIALPIAFGSYARQGLTTAEHLFIPHGMRMSGLGASSSLAAYGVLQGMVFPLLLFPSTVISSAANLLIPELAECKSLDNNTRIRHIVRKVFRWAICFSIGTATVFLFYAKELGYGVYGNSDAAKYIGVCALLVPVMYFDITVDCMLKGLGEQIHSMRINILDSVLSLLLAFILIPQFGITGYIISVYVCEGLNCLLSVKKLYRVTGVSIDVKGCLIPSLVCSALSCMACVVIPSHMGITTHVYLRMAIHVLIYTCSFLIFSMGKIKKLPNTVENSTAW